MPVTLWRTTLPTHSVPVTTEVLESKPSLLASLQDGCSESVQDRKLLVMFPGNPGIVYFYTHFVEELVACGFDVLVMGFVGHSIVDVNSGRYFQLQEQVEVASAFIAAILPAATAAYKQGGCYLAGHSIGGWMAIQMAGRFPHFKKAFLLAPTIFNMVQSPNGRKNKKFLKTWLITVFTSTVVPFAGSLPSSLFQFLLRSTQKELDPNGSWVAEQMPRRAMMRNMLMLAQSEFQQVTTLDVPLLQSIGHRLVFYFVKVDGWVPLSDVELIRNAVAPVKGSTVVLEENDLVPHAWCLKFNREVVQNGILPFV